jgi:glutamate-5-semialdehyde dehydrogenase
VSPADAAMAALRDEVEGLIARARAAAPAMAAASTAQKHAFLAAVADGLLHGAPGLEAANQRDVDAALAAGRSAALVDRLRLQGARLTGLAAAVREVMALADPVGAVTRGEVRPNGLEVRKQRIPLGIIGIVYEARPNVTVDAAALALKAGNTVILRGGSEARHSNAALITLLRNALQQAGLPADAVQAPASTDHRLVEVLVGVRGGLDLVIPRGGTALIEAVTEAARVPVIQHYQGVCHIFVEGTADLALAVQVAVNAKASRPAVCNAMEALLVDTAIAAEALPRLATALRQAGVQLRACPRSLAVLAATADSHGPAVTAASPADYGHEFGDLTCLVALVDGLPAALDHIRRYGSRHTEAILTRDLGAAQAFVQGVDASCVLVNASTRFNDGGCLGLGAEIGISTSKLHAYGPMGLEALTAERFVVFGQGQVRT